MSLTQNFTVIEMGSFIKKIFWFKLSLWEKFALIICFLFFSGIALGRYVEIFRFDQELRWIYQYGSLISLGTGVTTTILSLINTIVLWSKTTDIKRKILGTLISIIPFFLISILMIIAFFRT